MIDAFTTAVLILCSLVIASMVGMELRDVSEQENDRVKGVAR